ncbi:putative inactive receptor kinase [Acorus calamus]|uniref:Inactive receptor kinase n=1 Tax=Acorus calamus TaxID=4465 RepID=A0AAV9CAR6_ACOCL|nr:putative inactive receptor kinase [Acorus calamus]
MDGRDLQRRRVSHPVRPSPRVRNQRRDPSQHPQPSLRPPNPKPQIQRYHRALPFRLRQPHLPHQSLPPAQQLQRSLPSDLSVWRNLTVLDLSFNAFNGSIPSSISNLTHLTALNLSNNSFSGEVPDFGLPNLQLLNLSNNQLVGEIPRSLRRFSNSSFQGNSLVNSSVFDISPSPFSPPSLPPVLTPVPSLRKTHKKLSESALLGIIVGGCVVVFALTAILIILCYSKGKGENIKSLKKGSKERSSSLEKKAAGKQDENNRMVFFDGCNFAFDLEDLLRASAEVLGKGTFGTTYKAALEDAVTVVVKRLKDVGVGRREFEQQMEVVGRVRHENVVELRAYYYSKDEKLMVYDYYGLGSVSSMLHGKRGENKSPSIGRRESESLLGSREASRASTQKTMGSSSTAT